MSTSGNTDRPPGTTVTSSRMPRRLLWTAVLVLIALGGAGLAGAADRAPTDEQRPELTWRVEQAARPWYDALAGQLVGSEEQLATMSGAGRRTLARLSSLDAQAIEQSLAEGEEAGRRLDASLEWLAELRRRQREAIADTRLSQGGREWLAAVDEASAAAAPLSARWAEVAARGHEVRRLLDSLARHDELVFAATTAGTEERWADALARLAEAETPLAEANASTDRLAAVVDASTLRELLRRYAEYDAALIALYTAMRDGATQDSPEVRVLLVEVERAQAALPTNDDALSMTVAEAMGPLAAEALVEIERARGAVADALATVP